MFERYYNAKADFKDVPLHPLEDRRYWDRLRPYAEKAIVDYPEKIELLPASKYMEYRNTGNRSNYEKSFFGNRYRLCSMAVLEAAKNDGKLLPDIIDNVWAILDEFTWCLPAHNGIGGYGEADALPDPDDYVLDLFQAEAGAILAEVYYIFKDKFDEYSKNINKRIKKELRKRVIEPYLNREYNYMGFNKNVNSSVVDNWNPWITSNVLFVALVLKEGSVISKAAKVLDNYVSLAAEDGGCDEGPAYWFKAGFRLIKAAEYLRLLTGIDITDNQMLKNCAEFNIKANLYGNVFANFADAAPYIDTIHGYYGAAKITKNENIYNFAGNMYECNNKDYGKLFENRTGTITDSLYTIEAIADFEAEKKSFKHKESYYVESIQLKTFHKGEYDVAVKGGHNDERHNHNDVGNFIIAKNEELFIIDAGAKDYCADTFSERRYTIWVNRSSYHNLPEIGGREQLVGEKYRATNVESYDGGFSLDIASVYGNENILKWKRDIKVEETRVKVEEEYEFKDDTSSVLHLMTQFKPEKEEYGLSLTSDKGNKMEVHFNGEFTFDTIMSEDDSKLLANWGECVYRINIPVREAKSGKFEYIFI